MYWVNQKYQARMAKFICTDINWISIILSKCDHNVMVFLICLLYLSCKQTIWEHQGQGWGWELIGEGNYFTYKLIIMKHHKPTPHVQFSPSMSFQTEVQVMNTFLHKLRSYLKQTHKIQKKTQQFKSSLCSAGLQWRSSYIYILYFRIIILKYLTMFRGSCVVGCVWEL